MNTKAVADDLAALSQGCSGCQSEKKDQKSLSLAN